MRKHLRAFIANLSDAQSGVPRIATINPPLWEAAHVAWFAEWFCMRDASFREGKTQPLRDSIWNDCDSFLDSNTIAHAARWELPQLTRAATLDYLDRSHELVLQRLEAAEESDDGLYRFRLAMFHEAMHLEAIAWCAQTLAWPMPEWLTDDARRRSIILTKTSGESTNISGQNEILYGFRFDNEKPPFPKQNGRSTINSGPVSNMLFAEFVECGGYENAMSRKHPAYWRRTARGEWQQRRFDQWIALEANAPVVHVSALEADAYAAWVGGRLPTESELHDHFSTVHDAWHGYVWEWTATPFAPYVEQAEFKPGLYREYSQPWFDGKHRVLRGGSFATLPIMHHPHYRNFFTTERSDVFAGFRVIA